MKRAGLAHSFAVVLIGYLVFTLSACGNEAPERPSDFDSSVVSEELRRYLDSLRQELHTTQEQVDALNKKVSSLEGALAAVKRAQADAKNPPPKEVALSGVEMRGAESAKIAIIEFTDFECPYCSRHAIETFPKIASDLIDTGLVRYGVKDYPLAFHDNARSAAIAARCARQQGKYWEMHNALFANHKDLGGRLYKRLARKLELDLDDFNACLNDAAIGTAVDLDMAYGKTLGVTGTPKFFIGKVEGDSLVDVTIISGAQPYPAFSDAVERLREQMR